MPETEIAQKNIESKQKGIKQMMLTSIVFIAAIVMILTLCSFLYAFMGIEFTICALSFSVLTSVIKVRSDERNGHTRKRYIYSNHGNFEIIEEPK